MNQDRMQELETRIAELEAENRRLRGETENKGYHRERNAELTPGEIERYSRQMLIANGFGVEGQKKLLGSSVLIIGAGGIGSTAIPYLAAAGVGKVQVVDFDAIDVSNLHRQVIHKTQHVGMNKAISACNFVRELNPTIRAEAITEPLSGENVMDLVEGHDCVIDCSDNPKTRYLINDACVLKGKPLVSASAIGTEGQLTVYNHQGGPCYRCLYPKVSVTAGCRACTDLGVLGTVPGLMGVLEATEAIKVLTGSGEVMDDRLLMYDAMACSFTNMKKPKRRKNCPVCGESPTIKSINDSAENLLAAHGPGRSIAPPDLDDSFQISCKEFSKLRDAGTEHVLIDVRVKPQYDMCHLPASHHIPLSELSSRVDEIERLSNGKPIFCLCRRGIDSIEATTILHGASAMHPKLGPAKNIQGGLVKWREDVDSSFPRY